MTGSPHRPRARPPAARVALAAAALALAATLRAQDGSPEPVAGTVAPRIECAGFPGQSYALYLPTGYSRDRPWPILYCFDPAGRGQVPVERFQEAAERHGFIVAGSNNSRNGPWLRSHAAADAMLRDTFRRFRLDRRLCYAAGFSGGARVACRIAQAGDFAGVIACAAGFSQATVPERVPFVFYGTTGMDDFNYQEMRRTDAALESLGAAHRLAILDGGHAWLPAAATSRALEWLRVQSMRSGRAARDDAWLQDVFRIRMQEAAAIDRDAAAWREYTALAADFEGLVDTSPATARAEALQRTREVRRSLAAEKKAAEAEARWNAEVDAAIAALQAPGNNDAQPSAAETMARLWGEPARRFPSDRGETPEAAGAPVVGWERVSALDATALSQRDTGDPAARLRDLVRELNRRSRTEAAARRVLAGAFAGAFESAREAAAGRDFAGAARRLEIAIMLKPTDPRAQFDLACAYAALGRRREAQSRLDAAITAGFSDAPRIEEIAHLLAGNDASVAELEPFIVRDLPALETSFGLALGVTADPETRQILRLTVKAVAPNSEAEARGIAPGSVILSANGRSIQSLVAQFTRDSDFHRLFMERHTGETIELEIVTGPGEPVKVLTLTQGKGAASADRPWLPDSFP